MRMLAEKPRTLLGISVSKEIMANWRAMVALHRFTVGGFVTETDSGDTVRQQKKNLVTSLEMK